MIDLNYTYLNLQRSRMRYIAPIIFLFLFFQLPAQSPLCDYEKLMQEGKAHLARQEFRRAINKFNAAKTCNFSKIIEVDLALNQVFKAIDRQRRIAEEAERRARIAEREVRKQKDQITEALNEAEVSKQLAEQALQQIQVQSLASGLAGQALSIRNQGDWGTALRLAHEACLISRDSNYLARSIRIELISGDSALFWLRSLQGHTAGVTAASFSPDGQYLLTAGEDETARLWTLEGQEIARYDDHLGPVLDAVFSPDGRYILTSSSDKTIKIWEREADVPLLTLEGHQGSINSISFSPDGKYFASASSDNTVRLWSTKGEKLGVFAGHTAGVNSVAFSPDGAYLASSSYDKTVKMWDAVLGKELLTFVGHTDYVNAVGFSPDGSLIASASQDGSIKIWKVASGAEVMAIKGHEGSVNSVVFSPDGRNILSASWEDKTVRLWRLSSKENHFILRGHTNAVSQTNFSPSGRYIVTCSRDHSAKIWDSWQIPNGGRNSSDSLISWLDNDQIAAFSLKEYSSYDIPIEGKIAQCDTATASALCYDCAQYWEFKYSPKTQNNEPLKEAWCLYRRGGWKYQASRLGKKLRNEKPSCEAELPLPSEDMALLDRQKASYQRWLDNSGLGRVLRVFSANEEGEHFDLYLAFQYTDIDSIRVAWEALKNEVEERGNTSLEQELFYKMVSVFEVPQWNARVQAYDTYDLRFQPLFFRGIYFEDGQVKVEQSNPKYANRGFDLPRLDLSGFNDLSSTGVTSSLGRREVYELVFRFAREKFEKKGCDGQSPNISLLENSQVLRFEIKNICQAVLAEEASPAICKILESLGLDCKWKKQELLTFLFSYTPTERGFELKMELDGKYGPQRYENLPRGTYRNMEPEFKGYLEDYAAFFLAKLREFLRE